MRKSATVKDKARWTKALQALRAAERDAEFIEHLQREAATRRYGSAAEAYLSGANRHLH